MDSSLKERFARLGPIRGIDRATSGSAAVFVLRLPKNGTTPKTVDGAEAVARCGISLLRAKHAMDELLERSRVFVDLPMVADPQALVAELSAAGIAAAPVPPPANVDVRQVRERLRMSREQFAIHFGLELETVRNWEMGRRKPDTAARSYLRAIENDPELVEQAYAPTADVEALRGKPL